MDPLTRGQALARLAWLAGGVLAWGGVILGRLVHLQLFKHREFRKLAEQQQRKLIEIPAPRGTIYDQTGQPLAMSVPMRSVFVSPLRVPDLSVAADILAPILKLDRAQLYERMRSALRNRRGFLWVARKIEPEKYERLRSLSLDWIEFQTESQRHYPKGATAAHVLGSVDHEERGNSGIELGLDEELRGQSGALRLLTDVRNRGIESELSAEMVAGANLTLTIDERIQFVAERELRQAVLDANADTGSLVVMNPHTGDILALASFPSYDPNKPPAPGESLKPRLNLAISAPFEPGSVFKVITISAGLETGKVTPETPINCGNGAFNFFGRVIHEAKRGFGMMPVSDVLAKSSNIGAVQVALKVGPHAMLEYIRRFGFGKSTGIPLPAEHGGWVRDVKRWGKTSIGSIAMGHELSVTTLQLAQACAVIANGGLLVRPRLVLLRQRPGGSVERVPAEPPRRVLKPETAFAMRLMMEGVVQHGTGRRARLEGYSGGGKTGSAQIFDFKTRRYTHTYNASYMGFAPVTNPAIVVVATLNGTRGTSGFGGAVAAPVFRVVAEETLRILEVPKDVPETVPEPAEPAEVEDLAVAELSEPAEGETEPVPVAAVQPAAGAVWGPRAPDFAGKTLREVVEEASEKGLTMRLDGRGVARRQEPAAGSLLAAGEVIRVQFAR